MDKVFIRNFVIFMVILLLCAGSLSYSLIKGDRSLDKIDDLVLKTHDVISEAEQLSTHIEGMLAAQRGYLITGDETFRGDYESKKSLVSEHVATLAELTQRDASQQSRLDELRSYFSDFSLRLEERAESVNTTGDREIIKNVAAVDNLKNNIIRINSAILEEEYGVLNKRITSLNSRKRQYFNTLLISVAVGTILLLAFNGFLLHAQRRRSKAEASLKDTEERFALAIEGTEDGIFDWDVKKDKIFYSRRFFAMLGYDKPAYVGPSQDAKDLIHPEDLDQVLAYVDQYLDGTLNEYHQEFRMRHKSGRWVWIQSRAKALYDHDGNAIRMVGAHSDITHMVKAREKLEAEKQEAEEANQAKSEFLAHMSHEIRTPLTAISGIAEIFDRSKEALDDKHKKLVHTLLASTSTLKDLINDILDFSKIESGELELDERMFRLDELFQEVISMMSLKASEKGIGFDFDYKSLERAEFFGDPKRMRQILINLVNNAIKFTDKGAVTVRAFSEDRNGSDYLRIDVTDTGIGIAPDNFDLVFERFKRADSSVSRKYGGTGLGLPISRNLACLMGGDIYLSSQIDKGSTFSLLLPAKMSITHDQSDIVDIDSGLDESIKKISSQNDKILLVEDYQGNALVIGYVLDDIGLDYDTAETGKEALDLWEQHAYDIILMDIQMPEMDGFTATKTIRELEKKSGLGHTPIIGMTAHALVGDKDKCIEAGMDSYLSKPIVEADLKREILKYLRQKRKAA